jgi:hypothetical protein
MVQGLGFRVQGSGTGTGVGVCFIIRVALADLLQACILGVRGEG